MFFLVHDLRWDKRFFHTKEDAESPITAVCHILDFGKPSSLINFKIHLQTLHVNGCCAPADGIVPTKSFTAAGIRFCSSTSRCCTIPALIAVCDSLIYYVVYHQLQIKVSDRLNSISPQNIFK